VALATAGEGYSGQTVLHFKNAISAVFRLAKKLRLYPEENPAAGVELPEVKAQRRPVLNWEEARRALAHLPSPVREMAILGMTTSLGAAELTGIRLKHANLTDGIVCVEGEALAPYSIAVRENYYHGQYGSLKTGSRCRNLAITPELAEMLRTLVLRSKRQDSEAPLFQSRTGTPVCVHNISTRIFRPLGRKLGFPITWHSFRRACATFADQLGVSLGERMAVMGHTTSRMTLHYSIADVERRRAVPAQIMERLLEPPSLVQ
jgi:integrase